jgi:carbon storage regulator
MLVLCRKAGEEIVVPELNITLTVLEVDGHKVRIGVDAPEEIRFYRRELWQRMQQDRPSAMAGARRKG